MHFNMHNHFFFKGTVVDKYWYIYCIEEEINIQWIDWVSQSHKAIDENWGDMVREKYIMKRLNKRKGRW
jgi:hypothetical protein